MAIERVKPKEVPKVRLSEKQNEFVTELVRDNKPNLWNWRKYLKGIATGIGYSPMAVDKLRVTDKIWVAARSLINNIPVEIIVTPREEQSGVPADPDFDRKPGEPLKSARQERFCQELIADPSMRINKAAKRAGYRNNGEYGWQLNSLPKIQQRIQELKEERVERLVARQDEVLQNLVLLSRTNMADFVTRFDGTSIVFEDSQELTRDEMYGIKKIKQTIRGAGSNTTETFSITLEDKQRANALLAQHLGLLDREVTFDPTEFAVQLRQLSKEAAKTMPGGEI
jgi:phage terminase small subunit